MIWRFSDDTTAELGGHIEGASAFAQELRAQLAQDRVGVAFGYQPGGGAWLDRNDPALFDAWLEQERARMRDPSLRLLERPDGIPPLPELDDDELPEDAIR